MLALAVLLLVVLWVALRGLRTNVDWNPRWPFLVASTISGGAILVLIAAMVISLTVGRQTWNDWVSGSGTAESATLWLVVVVGPLLLATCIGLLVIGVVLRKRQKPR